VKNPRTVVAVLLLLTLALAGCAGSRRGASRPDDVHGSRAHRLFMNGELPRALESYRQAFAVASRVDNNVGAARALSNIGRVYFELGMSDSAALHFVMAYEEFVVFAGVAAASRSAAWAALSFAATGDEMRARCWLGTAETAAAIANAGSKRGRATDEHYFALMRGLIDFRLSSRVTDENALIAALAFYRKQKNHSSLSTLYVLLADMEFARGNCTAAKRLLDEALASMDKSGEMYRRSTALQRAAAVSFCLGEETAGRRYYRRAVDTVPRGLTVPPAEEVAACAITCHCFVCR
jgi:tetratricopeptide (TPR) repeat protein